MPIRRLLLVATLALLSSPLLAYLGPAGPGGENEMGLTLPWRSNLADHAWVERSEADLYSSYALNADVNWLGLPSNRGTAPWPVPPSYLGTSQPVEYFLDVTRPGKYYVWYLLRAPRPLTIKHLEGVDSSFGAPLGWVSLDIKQADTWTWLRREGQVEFTTGLHELQMDAWTPPHLPGLDLSLVVLASDDKFTPPPYGALPPLQTAVPWTSGTFYTADAQPSTVLKWGGVGCAWTGGAPVDKLGHLASESSGHVALSYSTDAGKTWVPLAFPRRSTGWLTETALDLSAVPVKSDGTDRIRFRATLTRPADQPFTPEFYLLHLAYIGDPHDLFCLFDSTARYFFATKSGALCGIQNAVTNTWLTPQRRPQPIFSLRLRPLAGGLEKDWETVTSLDAKCVSITPVPPTWEEDEGPVASASVLPSPRTTNHEPRTTFVYQITRPDGTATVTLTASQTAPGELTWTASVTNHLTKFSLVDLTYPIASGVSATGNPATDVMLINGNYLVHTPANFGRFLYFWPTSGIPLMDIFSPTEGLTVVAHDDTLRSTGISARGLDRQSVELSLVKIVNVLPGQSFTGAPHLMRVHQGDWHQVALAERPWLAVHRPTAVPPLWVSECDGWTMAGWPAGWWTNLPLLADAINPPLPSPPSTFHVPPSTFPSGLPWIQYWNFQVPGTNWTLAHPNPVNGDEDDLRWGIDQIHRRGLRTTFYIQGLLYDPQGDGNNPDDPIGFLHRRDLWPGWELPPAGFTEANRRRNADGEGHAWSAREVEMCYAAPGFQEYKRHWAIDLLMKRLGLDGIYWDSLSYGNTCWDADHAHGSDPGQFGVGAQTNHAEILREARKLNPAAVMANEGCPSDTLGEIDDVQLDNAPNLEIVRMFFPKMLIYLGNSDGADPSHQKSFLYGCRFDHIGSDPAQQALLRIRRLTKQYLYPATPMDTMGLQIDLPRGAGFQPATPGGTGVSPVSGAATIQAHWFLCDPTRTKGAVVTILNNQKVAGATITLPITQTGPIKTAWLVDSTGTDAPLPGGSPAADGKSYTFPVPEAVAATVLLLGPGAEPRVTVTNETLIARGGGAKITVQIESLTGERIRGLIWAGRDLADPSAGPRPVPDTEFRGNTDARSQTAMLTLPVGQAARLGLTDVPIELAYTDAFDAGLLPRPDRPTITKLATFYVEPPVRVTPTWAGPELLRVTVANRSTLPPAGHRHHPPRQGRRPLCFPPPSRRGRGAGGWALLALPTPPRRQNRPLYPPLRRLRLPDPLGRVRRTEGRRPDLPPLHPLPRRDSQRLLRAAPLAPGRARLVVGHHRRPQPAALGQGRLQRG